MPLTKKDFQALALQVRHQVDRSEGSDPAFKSGVLVMVDEIVKFCATQNNAFRTAQFVEACGLVCNQNGVIVFKD